MAGVFIGGSRAVRVLDEEARRQIDRIMAKGLPVLIGDADGADRLVQEYLHRHGYPHVEIFCMDGRCRHNVGLWPSRAVNAGGRRKGFRYYAAKDRVMAREAAAGLMIWDGCSAGTLANVGRLVRQGKTAVVYLAARKQGIRVGKETEWEQLLSGCSPALRTKVEEELRAEESQPAAKSEASLF